MSYQLECTEEDAEVKKAVDEAQAYYDAQDKREWVKWAGKMLMLHLHAQIAMEKADEMRVEQEQLEELRRQDKREQREQEQAEKEVAKKGELDEREEEYMQQLGAKEIDEKEFWELINELDLERVMALSVAEGLATTQAMTQDEGVWESEREESAEGEPAVAEIAVESSTVRKGKRKVAPARAKIYAAVYGPVSTLTSRHQYMLTNTLTVRPMFDAEDAADMHHQPV
jgi:hypothetical protein